MSAESDKIRDNFADQLASFDDRLDTKVDDVQMLADIQEGIGQLLASDSSSEATIRRLLQERYEQGALRNETFQLVKSMLDRFVTEKAPTTPGLVPGSELLSNSEPLVKSPSILDEIEDSDEPSLDDVYSTTDVIPQESVMETDSDSRVQAGSLLRDRFLLQEKLSGGSMGVVYKALDRRLAEADAEQPWVAIKVLSPQLAENGQALRALQQEATKGRCLIHPNIVRFIDFDRDDDLYFLVMEWLEGRTLADILDSTDARSIDYDAAISIVRQVGDALAYAHRCGIVHADVKPGNIMLMPNRDAKLFDFGVARVQQQGGPDFDPGVLGALTPAYSSMQVLTGEDPVAADDVFSLGCLMYRLIAGHRVFGPRNAAEASQEGMKPQRPQAITDDHWRALKKALSYSRVTRFSSIDEFMSALDNGGEDTISFEAPERFTGESESSVGKTLFVVVGLLAILGGGAYQMGYLDDWVPERESSGIRDVPAPDEILILPADEVVEDPIGEADVTPADSPEGVDATADRFDEPEDPPEPLVDFSTLPPPTAEVRFSLGGPRPRPVAIVLREDAAPAIVDFVRSGELGVPLTLKLDEVRFSGNRSPWGAGQYAFSNDGILHFPVGQARSRITMSMASDPLREADQQSTLRLREADSASTELAIVNVTLEDDDQREFEGRLPVNTVAFVASQASIRETDPAVQIDLVRFNPDDSPLEVEYSVFDVTATEGEDYFAPGNYSISFGPGQRAARLLIPLVRDSEIEGDEAFVVELTNPDAGMPADVYQRIAVMIREDVTLTP